MKERSSLRRKGPNRQAIKPSFDRGLTFKKKFHLLSFVSHSVAHYLKKLCFEINYLYLTFKAEGALALVWGT